jgi:hypothetical protein
MTSCRRVGGATIALLWVSGCLCGGGGAKINDGKFADSKVQYAIGEPGQGWEPIRVEQANGAWHSDALGSSLLVNSHCEGVADAPLEGLTSDLMMGMTDRNIESQKTIPFSKREAMETVATAKLDGVPRKLEMFVMKKDGCVYDIVLDSDPAHFDAAQAGYNRVRDGFDVAPRRDRS